VVSSDVVSSDVVSSRLDSSHVFGYSGRGNGKRLVHLDHAAVVNGNHFCRMIVAWVSRHLLHLPHSLHSFQDLAEGSVGGVQPMASAKGDIKLGAVRISTSICHRNPPRTVMLDDEIFVIKFVTIDANGASTVATGDITSLHHKTFNDAVECGALVGETIPGPGCDGFKVLHCSG